jgi:renalase
VSKRVAIIGAGVAGLASARALGESGHHVAIFEKSRALGGRIATRRVNGCTLDHGAQVVKPDGSSLADVMLLELPTDDLVQVTLRVRLYANDGTLFPPDPDRLQERAVAYRYGLTTLPKLLARALPADFAPIRFETRIGALEEDAGLIRLRNTDGNEVDRDDGVIITAPAPQVISPARRGQCSCGRPSRGLPHSCSGRRACGVEQVLPKPIAERRLGHFEKLYSD